MKNWLDFFLCLCKTGRDNMFFLACSCLKNNQVVVLLYLFASLITEMHENDLHNELYRIKKP